MAELPFYIAFEKGRCITEEVPRTIFLQNLSDQDNGHDLSQGKIIAKYGIPLRFIDIV